MVVFMTSFIHVKAQFGPNNVGSAMGNAGQAAGAAGAAGQKMGQAGQAAVKTGLDHLDQAARQTVYFLKNKLFCMRKLRYNKLLNREHYDTIHKFTSRIKGEINDVRTRIDH